MSRQSAPVHRASTDNGGRSTPEGKRWIHEIKLDGYRCQVLLEQGQAFILPATGMRERNSVARDVA
jgi:bifunctional non-homologous end joining protein LigD